MHRKMIAGIPLRADGTLPTLAGGSQILDRKVKDELKSIDAQIAEKRADLAVKTQEVDAAKEALGKKDGELELTSAEFLAAKNAKAEQGALQDEIAGLQSKQVELLKLIGESPEAIARANDVDPNLRKDAQGDSRAWDTSALDTPENRKLASAMAQTSTKMGQIQLGVVATDPRALMADTVASEDMRRGQYYGVLPQLARRLTLLDLIAVGTMTGNTIPYTEESGTFDGAEETAEGSMKPQTDWDYIDREETARTIPVFTKLQKQSLEDFPALQSIVDNRLRYMVLRRLEAQIASGDGNAPNLRGILNTSGIGNVPLDEDDLHADRLLTGITYSMLAEGDPNGVASNPLDWMKVLKAKANDGGDGQYYGGGPFSMTPQMIWGTPIVPVRTIPQGSSLVGDWQIGAQLFMRTGVRVLLSDSDQDDFTTNRVTVLAELRAALAKWRPSVFVEVELGALNS